MKRQIMTEEDPTGGDRCAKRLRFAEQSQLLIVPKNKEMQNAWYTKAEITQFKDRVRHSSKALSETRTAKAMKCIAHSAATGSQPLTIQIRSKETIRGIEHLISQDVMAYMLKRRAIHKSRVLAEQQAQICMNCVDTKRIAMVSKASSYYSKAWSSRITLL